MLQYSDSNTCVPPTVPSPPPPPSSPSPPQSTIVEDCEDQQLLSSGSLKHQDNHSTKCTPIEKNSPQYSKKNFSTTIPNTQPIKYGKLLSRSASASVSRNGQRSILPYSSMVINSTLYLYITFCSY